MEDDAAAIYGLEFQARTLCAQLAETDAVRFLVGTQSLKTENQLHQIDFDEENNLINKNVFLHKEGEIWHVSASPTDKNLVATCFNKISMGKCEMSSAVWRIPNEFDNTSLSDDSTLSAPSLDLVTMLNVSEFGNSVRCTLWQPGEGNGLVTLVNNHLLLWDLNESDSSAKLVGRNMLEAKGHPKFTAGCWNPHQNATQVFTANDSTIRGWDLRTMKPGCLIENSHGQLVRNLDFNPNKQYYLASCGDDCKTKFWDVRNSSQPLIVLSDHSHWVWSVRYNHFHDQLVLTSSSDSRVILTSLVSISSEPFGHLLEDELSGEDSSKGNNRTQPPNKDGVIATYEEHEDSVYVAEWSSADPWLFASLSYDGRLVVNRVPRAEKYRILL